jgi:hypothetical protein
MHELECSYGRNSGRRRSVRGRVGRETARTPAFAALVSLACKATAVNQVAEEVHCLSGDACDRGTLLAVAHRVS